VTSRWQERPEGGAYLAMWLLRGIALRAGRTFARLLLYPTTLYFFLRRGPERRASRAYLRRVFGREPSTLEVMRHLHCFGSTVLDRVYLLTDSFRGFEVTTHGLEELHRVIDQGRGVLLFGSHLGSFDALRVLAQKRPDVDVRVVLDLAHNPGVTRILSELNPKLAAGIIDAGQDGMTITLAIKDAVEHGALVTVLADRAVPGEHTVPASVLGAEARLPASPWLMAAVLKVPVALCFGLYRGGNRYDMHFEPFADALALKRRGRDHALAEVVQRYADRLTHHARNAPYNWFNFYDFWQTPAVRDDRAAAVVAAGDRARGEA
jgi:predicted LPLAT superfamily acyltransferase